MFSSNSTDPTDNAPQLVPLTAYQKLRLVVDCLPFAFFLLMLLLYLSVLQPMLGQSSRVFLIFMGIVLVYMGFIGVQRLRDLFSGVAEVRTDVLLRAHRSRSSSGYFYGKFEQLGRKRLISKAYFESRGQGRYRLIYSPHSQIVWSLEMIDGQYSGVK